MKWTKLPSGNLFADTGPTSRYWISFTGTRFRLEYMTKLNRYHDWAELGDYKTIPAAKRAATKREKGNVQENC